MKKLLLVLLLISVSVSCSKDDDDTKVTTDPLIGLWTYTYTTTTGTYNNSYNINSNGTYIYMEEAGETYLYEGEWSNDGTDFNSRNQIYSLTEDGFFSMEYMQLNFKITARFSSDFNSFEFFEEEDILLGNNGQKKYVYVRQ